MKLKLLVVTMFVAAMLCMASASYAQAPQVVIVGSSGAFASMSLSFTEPDPITAAAAPCTGAAGIANFWTNGSIQAIDSRTSQVASIPPETGTVAIAWNADAATIPSGPSPVVCAYLSLDTLLGQRLFFGTNNLGETGSISIAAADPVNDPVNCPSGTGVLGAFKVPVINDTANTLPCGVWLLLNNKQFNAAATDIRAEDALYANSRALTNCAAVGCATDNLKNGLGYGPAPLGQQVIGAPTGSKFNVYMYGLTGCDPLIQIQLGTCNTITPGVELQIGAYPIMIFYNSTVSTGSTGDFTANPPTDILHEVVANVFSASIDNSLKVGSTRTCDITGSFTLCAPLNIFNREPTSGTFQTFEFQLIRNKGTVQSQEFGVNPADNAGAGNANCSVFGVLPAAGTNCGNPYKHFFASSGATRNRVIGTGQMVKEIGSVTNVVGPPRTCKTDYGASFPNGIPNSIGYAFWSFASFADPCTLLNSKYLQLDGVDPLWSSYSANPRGAGVFNQCAAGPPIVCDAVPFTHMVNGDYRNWNIIRLVLKNNYLPPASGPSVPQMLLAAQDQAHSTIPDFVPFVYCNAGGGCTPAVVDSTQQTGVKQPTNVTAGLFAFRSHYGIPTVCVSLASGCTNVTFGTGVPAGLNPLNGTNQAAVGPYQPWSENQGDMAGAIFTVQSDQDHLKDVGTELVGYFQ